MNGNALFSSTVASQKYIETRDHPVVSASEIEREAKQLREVICHNSHAIVTALSRWSTGTEIIGGFHPGFCVWLNSSQAYPKRAMLGVWDSGDCRAKYPGGSFPPLFSDGVDPDVRKLVAFTPIKPYVVRALTTLASSAFIELPQELESVACLVNRRPPFLAAS